MQFVQQVPSSTYRAPKEIQIIEECKEKNQLKAEVQYGHICSWSFIHHIFEKLTDTVHIK